MGLPASQASFVSAAYPTKADQTPFRSRRGILLAALAASTVLAASTAGRLITATSLPNWYAALTKPWFNPPNWVFPVAWTLLFALMAIAFWRVLRAAPGTPRRAEGVALYLAQIVLNVGWSFAFFGIRSAVAGLVVVVPFLLAIVATWRAFRAVDRLAGWMLTPYIAWVAFATVLNAAIVRLNG